MVWVKSAGRHIAWPKITVESMVRYNFGERPVHLLASVRQRTLMSVSGALSRGQKREMGGAHGCIETLILISDPEMADYSFSSMHGRVLDLINEEYDLL
jgi:hypothetical protein